MPEQLTFNAVNRNPFRIAKLPFLARLYIQGYKKQRGLSKRLIGKPAKLLFKLLFRTFKLNGKGVFTFNNEHHISFSARNTQFHSIYLPHYISNYETEVCSLIDTLLPADGTFIDAGANWGFFTLYAVSRDGFKGRIHAFEPMNSSFDSLEHSVLQSGYPDHITCHMTALSDSSEKKHISITDSIHSGIAAITPDNTGDEIECNRLDALDIGPIDLLKIDTEGHESQVISGASEAIYRHRPHLIFEHWLGGNISATGSDPLHLLSDLGYIFFHPGWIDPGTRQPTIQPPFYQPGDMMTLVLTQFSMNQRHILKKQINIFACHKERLDEVKFLFGIGIDT